MSLSAIAALVVGGGHRGGGPARRQAFNGGFVADGATAFAKVVIFVAVSAVAIVLGDPWLVRVKNSPIRVPGADPPGFDSAWG